MIAELKEDSSGSGIRMSSILDDNIDIGAGAEWGKDVEHAEPLDGWMGLSDSLSCEAHGTDVL